MGCNVQIHESLTTRGDHCSDEDIQREQFISFCEQETEREWLNRSAVGVLLNSSIGQDLKNILANEGMEVDIAGLGGNRVLISFQSYAHLCDFLEFGELWQSRWFSSVKIWDVSDQCPVRCTWVKCFGVPLQAWNGEFFKKVGNKVGVFLHSDEATIAKQSLEFARLYIQVEGDDLINSSLTVKVGVVMYTIKVIEEVVAGCGEMQEDPQAADMTRETVKAGDSLFKCNLQIGLDNGLVPYPLDLDPFLLRERRPYVDVFLTTEPSFFRGT